MYKFEVFFCTLECLFILNIHDEILEHIQNLNTCSMFPIISLEKEASKKNTFLAENEIKSNNNKKNRIRWDQVRWVGDNEDVTKY